MSTKRTKTKSKQTIREDEKLVKQSFQYEWAKFIHRVKVHELLRCLENEQKKLKVLREHADLNEILMGVGVPAQEKKAEDSDSVSSVKSLAAAESEASTESLIQGIKSADGPISKTAANLFKTKVDVTEEQFEQILQLCKDRAEQKQLRDAFHDKKYREKYLHNASERRKMLYEFMNSKTFNRFLLFLIFISTLIIVLLTFESIEIRYTFPLRICDSIIISVFLVEACCKINIYKVDYFKNVWNILDLSIIITHFVEIGVELVTKILALSTNINSSIIFRLLKSLRSLRLLRTIKFLPNLQVIVSTIFESMISMGSIGLLMIIILIVFAVVGRGLFHENSPQHFGSIWTAMLTLFQLLTLDDWFDLPDDYDKTGVGAYYYIFVAYLFLYILLEYFVFLNLFVAVLVDNFQLSLEDVQHGEAAEAVDRENVEAISKAAEEENDLDESLGIDVKQNPGPDLKIEDYYGLDPESEEMKLMAENFKMLTSIDFEYFMLMRRMSLTGTVLDTAVATKQNTWSVQDAIERRLGEDKSDEEEEVNLK